MFTAPSFLAVCTFSVLLLLIKLSILLGIFVKFSVVNIFKMFALGKFSSFHMLIREQGAALS